MIDNAGLQSLYQYAMSLCQSRDDAYDLSQHAVEKYLSRSRTNDLTDHDPARQDLAPQDRAPQNLAAQDLNPQEKGAYLRRAVRNKFIDNYRSDQRWDSESYEENSAYDISLQPLEQNIIAMDELDKIWRLLEPVDRDILYHWAILGMSASEAATELGLARGTILSRIHRLRKTLEKNLTDDNIPMEGSL
ncbi:MAG: RNA polymerase sigma factor (sigma-70 family) [Flavobacteriales bacterium]|jgi:RNA polymerase sigma factor (sigma-70 family)